jgi:phosphoribosylformylglycinamidine synthase
VAPTVAVLRFPGSNCERESLLAVERAGLAGRIVRWNEAPETLLRFDAYVLPGGFSYQDRIRAGAVAARLPLCEVVARRAREGAPVFGICNGAQILVEAGLVPGSGETGAVRLALAPNRIARRDGYYTRWVFLAPGEAAGRCLFTRGLDEPVPMPMAHGEGRFVTSEARLGERLGEEVALRYAQPDGAAARGFPWNPNGSEADAAGLVGGEGNVLALMPHPERAQWLAQVPEGLAGSWGERRRRAAGAADLAADGPGLRLFRNLAASLGLREGGSR